MSRDDSRPLAALVQPQTVSCYRGGQHHRLGIDRLRQRFGWPIGQELPKILAQGCRCLVKSGAHHGQVAVCGHHADGLRTLPRKNESECHGIILLELEQYGAPGNAAADTGKQDLLPGSDAPIANRGIECQGDGRRRRVAMAVDGDDDLVHIQPEFLGR